MTTPELLDFNDAIKRCNKPPHALLGNGFSVACRPNLFNYSRLLDQANLADRPQAREAFDRLGTTDFEIVMNGLSRAAELAEVYATSDATLAARFREDAEALKEVLVQTIAGSHPDRPKAITDEECAAAKRFLGNFRGKGDKQKIYLLNYDLLTYWAFMRSDAEPQLQFDDGFRQPEDGPEEWVVWDSNRHKQDLFYLHGGLHIYQSGPEIRKFTWSNTRIPLMDQIRSALNDNRFPLYVAEGTWEDKLSRIRRSDFLGRGRRSFCQIGGSLFIYGLSLSDNDDHILHAIAGGNVEQIFVSVYGDAKTEANRALIERALTLSDRRQQAHGGKYVKALDIRFFDAESAQVWSI
ncbi:MAG: DUF4917 family protein [Phycisphaerales bacterium]|nr:DUF4917 family protein [Planctomycetota bacterium]MCH8507151.1 DUF4917 family protein [Phycisphaerales bacterium]